MTGRSKSRQRVGQGVTVGALVLLVLLWARLFFIQPRAEGLLEPADPRQTQIAERKRSELSGAVQRLSAAARHGEARSTNLQFSAAEINAMLAAEPDVQDALAEARISAPEIRFQPGRVITTASVEKATVPVPITAEGELSARGGLLLYASTSVRVAGTPASPPVRAAVDARIQAAFHHVEQQLHARVDRVTLAHNRMTLSLSSRPE
jgi:hypothetical protein